MPYAPSDIRRSVESSGDVTVTWERRTRLGGNMQDGTGEVTLGETIEQYEAYVLAQPFSGDTSRGLPPASYRRFYSLTSPSFTYTQADQQADGYDVNLDTLNVVIYQLSAAVGRGFPGTRSILSTADF